MTQGLGGFLLLFGLAGAGAELVAGGPGDGVCVHMCPSLSFHQDAHQYIKFNKNQLYPKVMYKVYDV